MKDLVFLRGTRRRLKSFPEEARRESGHQLMLVQKGLDPEDWRPMNTIGFGVREIRVHKPHEHRVITLLTSPTLYSFYMLLRKRPNLQRSTILR